MHQTALRAVLLLFALAALGGCGAEPAAPLARAAAAGDVQAVGALLDAGHIPDADDSGDAWPPLAHAARRGHLAVMTQLLDAGAAIDRQDAGHAWTPLMHALHKRQRGAVRLLVARGARTDLAPPGGTSPLAMAALDNDTATMRLLLAAGTTHAQQQSALAIAVSGGALTDIDRPLIGGCHDDAVRMLRETHPDVGLPETHAGRSARWWARVKGCRAVLRALDAPAGRDARR